MASSFRKDYDLLLRRILTDFQNLADPPTDFSIGSVTYVSAAVLAAISKALYDDQDYITRQIMPSSENDTEFLNKWGGLYAIPRFDDDTDTTYLSKILDRLRTPNAGGNENDYGNWALDRTRSFYTDSTVDPVVTYFNSFATVESNAGGTAGSVAVYTIPNDETVIFDPAFSITGLTTGVTANKLVDTSETFVIKGVAQGFRVTNTFTNRKAFVTNVDSETVLTLDTDIFPSSPVGYNIFSIEELLRKETEDYIEGIRPGAILSTTVASAKPTTLAVTIDTTQGPDYNETNITTQVLEYMNGLKPGESFFSAVVVCIGQNNGSTSTIVTVPAAAETTIANTNFYRPGAISYV